MDLVTVSGKMEVTITASSDRTKVYEICWDCSDDGNCAETEEALMITLHPTTNKVQIDLCTQHILRHLEELGLKKLHLLYLFSNVCPVRPSVKELTLEDDNFAFLGQALQNYKNAKLIIGWGSSMSNCATAISAKKRILEMMTSREDKQLWQLGCKEEGATENMHPLFMGIRYSNSKWLLKHYEIPEELKMSEDVKETSEPVENVVVAKRISKAKQAEKLRK